MCSFISKPFSVLIKRVDFEAVSAKRREELLRIVNTESDRRAFIRGDSRTIDHANLLPDLAICMTARRIYEILYTNN